MPRSARPLLLLLAALGLNGARAAEHGTPAALPNFAVLEKLSPADPLPERETRWAEPGITFTDVVYATRPGHRPLHLDLYRDAGATGARPLVVFLHGGGWAQGNPRVGGGFANFPAVLAHVARRGYVVASISYRLSGEAPFPAPVEDLQAALRFLRSGSARYGIDPQRVALWGLSSGAQIAALEAVRCQAGDCVQALVGWFGPYDLASYLTENPPSTSVQGYLRCPATGCAREALDAASPSVHVRAGAPPTLLVHGLADANVPPSQSQRFATALLKAGADARVLALPDVGHGLIGAEAATTKRALDQALDTTLAFFDETLAAVPTPQR
jgi:acetyl esterase/lipase